jgi:FkbM family methyltransferase
MNDNSIKNQRLWDWNRIKKYKSTDRTHHKEILEIINIINFDCFIDCGVGNVGSEAWSVKDLKSNCVIIGFEPQNERYELLKNNSYPGDLLKLVVGKKCEEVEGFMGYEDGGKSDFWLYGGDVESDNAYQKVKLSCITIDKIVEEYNLLNKKIFIWADIEGSELDMLYGAQETLKNNLITGFNMELRDYREAPNHCLAQEVIDFLAIYNIHSLTSREIIGTHKDFLFKLT